MEPYLVATRDGVEHQLRQPEKKCFPERTFEERRQTMYGAIRRMKTKPGLIDEAVRRIENGFVPLVSSVPGFVEYVGV